MHQTKLTYINPVLSVNPNQRLYTSAWNAGISILNPERMFSGGSLSSSYPENKSYLKLIVLNEAKIGTSLTTLVFSSCTFILSSHNR